MPRTSLQFHADPAELVGELLPRWLDGLDFWAVEEPLLGSSQRRALPRGALRHADQETTTPFRIFLGLRPFVRIDGAAREFQAANEGFLVIKPGGVTPEGLRETSMGSMAVDPLAVRVWRRVMQRAQKDLRHGAVVVNPYGERFDAPHHRYSDRAFAMGKAGVPMLALAGTNRYELGQHATP